MQSELLAALARVGIEAVLAARARRSTRTVHEAVAQQPVEGAEPARSSRSTSAGYRLGDDVLRPAKVVVAA